MWYTIERRRLLILRTLGVNPTTPHTSCMDLVNYWRFSLLICKKWILISSCVRRAPVRWKQVTFAKGSVIHSSFLLMPISSSVAHSHVLGTWGRQTQPAWSCNSGINLDMKAQWCWASKNSHTRRCWEIGTTSGENFHRRKLGDW